MNNLSKRLLQLFCSLFILLISQQMVSAQVVVTSSDIMRGSMVFVYKPPKKFFSSTATKPKPANPNNKNSSAAKNTRSVSGKQPAAVGVAPDEPVAPEYWINEQADYAIEERKTSDSEPFLSLSEGYLNSRIYFCETPQFPAAALKAKKQSVKSKVMVTVGKYGGLLDATTLEDDPIFRNEVYSKLGSMNFRKSFFMGKLVRIEGLLNFTQNPKNTVLCKEAPKELEVPAVIDGDVLNEMANACEIPQFPADAKAANLKAVEAKVEVVIDELGKVIFSRAVDGHKSFGESAAEFAKKTTFPKSQIAGIPVKVRGFLIYKQTPENTARCVSETKN